jgi:hypothetical protein
MFADLFLSVNVVASSLIKTHFVFVSFGFTKTLWQCGVKKEIAVSLWFEDIL